MCRLAVYKGPAVSLSDVLFKSSNSLIHQSNRAGSDCLIPGLPDCLQMPVNMDGTGVAWYDSKRASNRYRAPFPAFADDGLREVSKSIQSDLMFGHVRSAAAGVTGESAAAVGETNCHPFAYKNLTFMHNGAISCFAKVRHHLEQHLTKEAASIIQGNTDSELLFALWLSQLGDLSAKHSALHLAHALDKTIGIITSTTAQAGIVHASSLNMAVTNGLHVVVSRYRNSPTEQPPSLYMSHGSGLAVGDDNCLRFARPHGVGGVVISSEPLCSRSLERWSIVPKNTMVVAVAD
ncbi:nucleophile aminohydrolase, partial [Tribonema minus]